MQGTFAPRRGAAASGRRHGRQYRGHFAGVMWPRTHAGRSHGCSLGGVCSRKPRRTGSGATAGPGAGQTHGQAGLLYNGRAARSRANQWHCGGHGGARAMAWGAAVMGRGRPWREGGIEGQRQAWEGHANVERGRNAAQARKFIELEDCTSQGQPRGGQGRRTGGRAAGRAATAAKTSQTGLPPPYPARTGAAAAPGCRALRCSACVWGAPAAPRGRGAASQ